VLWIMSYLAITDSPLFITFMFPPSPLRTFLFFPSLSAPTPPQGPPRTIFRFDEEDPYTFSTHLRQILPFETQFSLFDSASTKYNYLSYTIWNLVLMSYPHSTQSTSQKNKSCPMNRWYDEECNALHRQLRMHIPMLIPPIPTSKLPIVIYSVVRNTSLSLR
jgi:hypothetical protein